VSVEQNLSQSRIDELKKEGQRRSRLGDNSLSDEVAGLQLGGTRVSAITGNTDKLNKYFEDAAQTVSAVKEIFGSKSIQELDAAMQTFFGGGLDDIGQTAARFKAARVKAMAGAYFGGNMQEAAKFTVAAGNSVTSFLGGPGMSPQEAQERFALVGASVGATVASYSLAGGASQANSSGFLSQFGIDTRPRGEAEIQMRTAQDVAAFMDEEEEALALASVYQQYEATLSDTEKANIQKSLNAVSSASSPEELQRKRAEANALVSSLTGGLSTRDVLAAGGGEKAVLEGLKGEALDMFGGMAEKTLLSRNQAALREGYEGDTGLQYRLGLGADDVATLGAGMSNLSEEQIKKLAGVRSGRELDALLDDEGFARNLTASGIDQSAFVDAFGRTDVDGVMTIYGN
jgi:hypothetical protein